MKAENVKENSMDFRKVVQSIETPLLPTREISRRTATDIDEFGFRKEPTDRTLNGDGTKREKQRSSTATASPRAGVRTENFKWFYDNPKDRLRGYEELYRPSGSYKKKDCAAH
jgi:hypothetical protein